MIGMTKSNVASQLIKNSVMLVQALDRQRQPAALLQERVLRHLLKRAEHTALGQHYHFHQLFAEEDPVAAFRAAVPLHDYDSIFETWWKRALDGEANVAWRGKVKYFALSSGTAGAASKYIPVTADMQRAMRQGGLRMFSCLPKYDLPSNLYTKDWLMIGGSATLTPLPGGALAGDLSGINARRPPVWLRRYYKPGTRIARLQSWDKRVAAIVRNAPKWDVGVIVGIPSWVTLTLEHIVERYGLENIHQLWPNLRVFVSGGIAFEPYRHSLERLLAEPLIYQDSYLASEGFIAFQSRPETHAMRLLLNNGIFYEFVPFDEQHFTEEGKLRPEAQALTIDQVRPGVDYALLLTTCAGAWRYLIGDTVRFTDVVRSEIVITGRTKHFLSLCGEHLSVDNMNQAIQNISDDLEIAIPEFTVGGVKVDGHYAHHWYLGTDDPVDATRLATLLDEALKMVNDDYGAERSAMLQAPIVTALPVSIFFDWQRDRGRLNGQSKIPRVMQKAQLEEWEAYLREHTRILPNN